MLSISMVSELFKTEIAPIIVSYPCEKSEEDLKNYLFITK